MRSLGFTFLLLVATAGLCVLAGWQWRQGNFDMLLGAPPTPVGARIYTSFTPDEVKHIRISGRGPGATFTRGENGWQASAPWSDRMDPRAAVGIIHFTLGMRVEDLAAMQDIDPNQAGLGKDSVNVRLEAADHTSLANFKLGRMTPWKAEVEGAEQPVATVFVQPRDKNRKRHLYVCTGDINSLFNDGLKFLRDHHPFYFNPLAQQKIRIRTQQGDLTLGREAPQSPWRIVKPLDLPTDPAAIKHLLEGLFELKATQLAERAAVTPPTNGSATKPGQIALTAFGSETETLLEIHPPKSPEDHEILATVSDRPNTVFTLPLRPEPGFVSLADLPLTVNELRDPTLTHVNIASISAIAIQPATGPEILVSRKSPQPWMTTIEGVSALANEENLFALLKAVTASRAIGFESDAATDFTPWGLHRPVLKLRFLSQDNQALELRFGIDGKGGWFVNRLGTPTVMRVDESLVSEIAVRPYEWRHARLWSLNRVNLIGVKITEGSTPPLVLGYDFLNESWQATRDGTDLGANLDSASANYLLGILEGLKVTRWLAPSDEGANTALKKPSLSFTVTELLKDDNDETTGVLDRTVILAPAAPGANPGLYYGRLDQDPNPFLLDRDTYQKLAADLLGN